MINWDDFRYILAISKAGNLPAAGKELGVAVSTVMRRLEKIERIAGSPVFEKSSQGYFPTRLGCELVTVAEDMTEHAHKAEGYVRNAGETLRGQVRISGSEVIVPFFLARHLPAIQRDQPELKFQLTIQGASPSQPESEFDLSFWPKCPSDPDLFGRKLVRIRWAQYGVDPAASLSGMIGFQGGDGARAAMEAQEAIFGKVDSPTSTNSLVTAAALTAAGGAPAFLPCLLGESWPGLVRLSAPVDHEIGELWVVFRKEYQRAKRLRFVISRLATAAKRDRGLFLGQQSD